MHLIRAYVASFLIIAFTFTGAPPSVATSRADIDASLRRAAEAREAARQAADSAEQYRTEARALDEVIRDLQGEVADIEPRITEATGRTARLQAELETLRTQISKKEEEIEKTVAELERQQELLNARITASYKQGTWFFLDLLLDSDTISDLITRTTLVQRVISANHDITVQLADTNERLTMQRAELDRARETVTLKRAEAAAVEKSLKDLRSQHQSALKRQQTAQNEKTALMEASEDDAERLRAQAEEEEATARRLEAELRAQASSGSGQYQGVMAWPVPGGSLTSPYGWRTHPIFGTRRFHHGIDISRGDSTIVAAGDGTVVRAQYGWNGGYGNMIVIDHGDGVTTVYTHILDGSFVVSSGERVTKGQRIALVGSTGYSTGPHLHFEVRINGASTDPMPFLR
ncbi:MAG: peptidoglycan DD-metalloendopeptidase family protein [Clostridiales bacterium]|nr:peptidoglycan DD-metalloendopeptidase family protein [Clostridiales bacterium]